MTGGFPVDWTIRTRDGAIFSGPLLENEDKFFFEDLVTLDLSRNKLSGKSVRTRSPWPSFFA
jgi:hypothetical protein